MMQMIIMRLLLYTALICLAGIPAHAQAWLTLWNPQMPAATYNDGSAVVSSRVPLQAWPWTNDAMSRGLLSVWLEPDNEGYASSLVHATPYGYPANHNEMMDVIINGAV